MSSNEEIVDKESSFISHLLELRDRLMRMVLAILVFFLALFPFANDIYVFVAEPLMAELPQGTTMIATAVASPFLTPFKLSLVAAIFIAMPYLLYQFWGFIAPGLYTHEKRLAFPLLSSSILLFYAGAAFAYFVVFPLVFAFMVAVTPEGVAMMTDIGQYLDFVLMLFFAFGLAFEVPIATILMVLVGMTTPNKLAAKRPFIIVGAFVIGMFLTPPDVISQTLLAIPMWILFELGVIFARMAKPNADKEDEDDEDDEPVASSKKSEPEQENTIHKAPAAAAAATAATETAEVEVEETTSYEPFQSSEAGYLEEEGDFRPMTEEEMEEELDAIEAEGWDEDDDDYYGDMEDGDQPLDDSEDQPAESDREKDVETDETSDSTKQVEQPEYARHEGDSSEVPEDDDEPFKPAEPSTDNPETRGAVLAKLEKVMQLREELKLQEARELLYEVLVEGNETQVRVARNILAQLDELAE